MRASHTKALPWSKLRSHLHPCSPVPHHVCPIGGLLMCPLSQTFGAVRTFSSWPFVPSLSQASWPSFPSMCSHRMTSALLPGDDCDITLSLGGHSHSTNWHPAFATRVPHDVSDAASLHWSHLNPDVRVWFPLSPLPCTVSDESTTQRACKCVTFCRWPGPAPSVGRFQAQPYLSTPCGGRGWHHALLHHPPQQPRGALRTKSTYCRPLASSGGGQNVPEYLVSLSLTLNKLAF